MKICKSVIHSLTLVFWIAGGCGNGSDSTDPIELRQGDFVLNFDTDTLTLTLERLDQPVLVLDAESFSLGRVDAPDDETNYDPWPLLVEGGIADYTPPAGLRWIQPASALANKPDEHTLELALTYRDGSQAELRVELLSAGRYRVHWQPAADAPIAYFRLTPQVGANEGFYGLGAYLDQVQHRGKIRSMQLELDLELESGYNEAHVPIPFVIGTRGWGLFVQNPYPAAFDVASQTPERVAAVFGTGLASSEGLTFYLFADEHPLAITRHYYAITGAPLLPARWALGPWIWRDENRDQAEVLADAAAVRDLDLPTTALWVDRPYASGVNTFDFDPGMFDDAQAMIDELHDLGLRFGLWHTPYLDADDPDTASLRQQAEAEGYFPPKTGILFNSWSKPIDLSNPDAYAWWQELIRRYTDMGVEGFKLDYAEDVVPGLVGARNKWEFHDGSDERTMHGRYQLFYHRVYAETMPADGGFLICRAATFGDQVNVSVIWPGDLDANMAYHRDLIDEGGDAYVAVGGLPASLIYGLSLGPSGFPFYGADTGGYRHCPPDKEVFTRWFQQTALSSVMQVGTSCNDVAWELGGQNGFDQEMLDWYRLYTRLHLRLWPYEWSLAQRIAETGHPIMRPFGLAYPEQNQHPNDIYLFGPDLLVAPVVDYGDRDKRVIFPPGRWIDWWSGQVFEGPGEQTVPAPLGHLPLYLREGGIIPMLRPTIEAMAPTGQPARVDSYATSPGRLYARIAPGETSSFELFDGTNISQQDEGTSIQLSLTAGDEFDLGFQLELIAFGADPPSLVESDGAPLTQAADLPTLEAAESAWFHDPSDGGWLHIRIPAGAGLLKITR